MDYIGSLCLSEGSRVTGGRMDLLPFHSAPRVPGEDSGKVRANREVLLARIRILLAGKLPRGLERVSGNFSGLLYPGGNSFFRMKKRKLLARGGATSLSNLPPRRPGKFNNFSKARGLLPPEFPRNANISITINGGRRRRERGRLPLPFILSTIFSQVTR